MPHPLPYHLKALDYFQQQKEAWEFFASHKHRDQQLNEFKTHLLKNTYKFDRESDRGIYDKIALVKDKLDLALEVSAYQAENESDMGASVIFLNGEAHVVFAGKITSFLSDEELLAVIAHELAHIQLYTQADAKLETADRMVLAMANHYGSTFAHFETARLFRLYTEIFCDRSACIVSGSIHPIISCLVRLATGLEKVNVASYLKQSDEIFSSESGTRTSHLSHPENFIRARALNLWHEYGPAAEDDIQKMIEGHVSLDDLDLFAQKRLTELTGQLIQLILQPPFMKSEKTQALARQFFATDLPPASDPAKLCATIEMLHTNVKDYLAYILYDFASCDSELEDVPLGWAFACADRLKISDALSRSVKKEQKLTEKKVTMLRKKLSEELARQPGVENILQTAAATPASAPHTTAND